MLNHESIDLFRHTCDYVQNFSMRLHTIDGAMVVDAGIKTAGSLDAGLLLARLCMGDQADIQIVPADPDRYAVDNGVHVRTETPVLACLGAQYAGWPIKTDDFFAMGSGPMRLFRGREDVLKELKLAEEGDAVVGVLESDDLPTTAAIQLIAQECGIQTAGVHLAIAPSSSIAGSVQVVARSIETALHKLHELKFDLSNVITATGFAPLPPPAKPGDSIGGIGRTNDAMLYGARVTLWVRCEDDAIMAVLDQVPSGASKDHGRPFAQVFKDYDYDFYKVDPMLFSPAVVTFHNIATGKTFSSGQTNIQTLRESFFA